MAARRGLLLCARSLQAGDALTPLASSSSRLLSCESGGAARSRSWASLQSPSSSSSSIAVRRLSSSTSSSSSASASSPTARTYTERKLFAYPPNQVFDVVADVQHYDLFVPWCVRSTVLRVGGGGSRGGIGGGAEGASEASSSSVAVAVGEEEGELEPSSSSSSSSPCSGNLEMEAELEVGFRNFSERYTSCVTLTPPSSVLTTAAGSSLFRHLDCRWRFAEGPLPAKTTWVSFSVSFEFRSAVHRHLASVFFDDVVRRMVAAFEGRCAELYGAPSVGRRRRVVAGAAAPSSPSSATATAAAATAAASAREREREQQEGGGKLPA